MQTYGPNANSGYVPDFSTLGTPIFDKARALLTTTLWSSSLPVASIQGEAALRHCASNRVIWLIPFQQLLQPASCATGPCNAEHTGLHSPDCSTGCHPADHALRELRSVSPNRSRLQAWRPVLRPALPERLLWARCNREFCGAGEPDAQELWGRQGDMGCTRPPDFRCIPASILLPCRQASLLTSRSSSPPLVTHVCHAMPRSSASFRACSPASRSAPPCLCRAVHRPGAHSSGWRLHLWAHLR